MLAVNELLTSPGSCLFAQVGDVDAVPPRRARRAGGALMYDLAALGIAAVCFAFCFFVLYVLEKV